MQRLLKICEILNLWIEKYRMKILYLNMHREFILNLFSLPQFLPTAGYNLLKQYASLQKCISPLRDVKSFMLAIETLEKNLHYESTE